MRLAVTAGIPPWEMEDLSLAELERWAGAARREQHRTLRLTLLAMSAAFGSRDAHNEFLRATRDD